MEEPAEKALVQCLRIAGREIRPPRATAQQGIPREHAIGQHEADRVVRVTRCVDDAQPEPPRDDRLAVVDAHVDVGREARAVHDTRHLEAPREVARGREMVGVGVRVDDVMEAQPRPGGEREVAIDLAQLRVDEHRTARLGAAHEIGEAAARAHLLEDHRRGDSRASVLALSTAVATAAKSRS